MQDYLFHARFSLSCKILSSTQDSLFHAKSLFLPPKGICAVLEHDVNNVMLIIAALMASEVGPPRLAGTGPDEKLMYNKGLEFCCA